MRWIVIFYVAFVTSVEAQGARAIPCESGSASNCSRQNNGVSAIGNAAPISRLPPINSTTQSDSISSALDDVERMEAQAGLSQSAAPLPTDPAREAMSYSCQEAQKLAKAVTTSDRGAACALYATAVQIASCKDALIAQGVNEESLNSSYSGAVDGYLKVANAQLSVPKCLK